MNYPLISEYIEAIRCPEENFEELTNLCPVLDEEGNPIMSSGNFAVVFKMKDKSTAKLYAVKCFLKDQEGREESYRLIEEELGFVSSPYLTSIRYLEEELFVDSSSVEEEVFPVLLMDWVDGVTLDKYICTHIVYAYDLAMLAYRFSILATWLLSQPFAHGDLKCDNILVKEDGTLTLVDYDGMFVPAMSGKHARELGSPNFRHPSRTEKDFNNHIDDFPLISILLSLKAISLHPNLWKEYGGSERLLFSEEDYRDISKCRLIQEFFPSKDLELNVLVSFFILSLGKVVSPGFNYGWTNLNYPQSMSTMSTKNDLRNAVVDEFQGKYSADGMRLLCIPRGVDRYSIKKGTKVICDNFIDANRISHLTIPSSVNYIGRKAFEIAPGGELNLTNESDNFIIENGLFLSRDKTRLISCLSRQHVIVNIPKETRFIDEYAFFSRYTWAYDNPPYFIRIQNEIYTRFKNHYARLIVPNANLQRKLVKRGFDKDEIIVGDVFVDIYGVVYSYDKTKLLCFPKEFKLSSYWVNEECLEIVSDAFNYLPDPDDEVVYIIGNKLKNLYLPSSLGKIGDNALYGCNSLEKIIVPQGTITKFTKLLPMFEAKLEEFEGWDSKHLAHIIYGSPSMHGWKKRTERSLIKEETCRVIQTEVVESTYGKNVRFYLNDGNISEIPLLDPNAMSIGEVVDMSKAKLIALCKDGEADIFRVKV